MESRSRVALVRCDSYDEEEVSRAVRKGVDLLGGISGFVKTGEKIVLKPNVLIGTNPDKAVTTNPEVLKAVGILLKELGVKVCYGDSPSVGKSSLNLRMSKLRQIGKQNGFSQADFDSGRRVDHRSALLIKSFVLANGVLDADGLISLPKFKTHGLTRFTGAVKNQFGCVPGTLKGQFHAELPDPFDFAAMLVDLNTLIRPRLYIMDGIVAMEGNGPRSGKPKWLNLLLMSEDPIALDATACRIIDLDPEFVPTSLFGEKAGLGTYHSEEIDVVGETIQSFLNPDFDVVREPVSHASGGQMRTFIKNNITPRPVIDNSKCTKCGTCVRMCPVEPKAVDWRQGDKTQPPRHNYDFCIRCYCCQEVCPEGAISIETPLLGKVFSKV